MKKYLKNYHQKMNVARFILQKAIIWISFAVNLGTLILSPFSYLNAFLLMVLFAIFIFYVSRMRGSIVYSEVRRRWYFYLNLLVVAFVVRYVLLFMYGLLFST
jgi:hypothetical protein